MSSVIKISEAASLALHTMVVLAKNRNKIFTTKDIAIFLNASRDHLSKVLQRLEKENFIVSVKGPKGGFKIGKNKEDVTLLQIYEAIDGPLLPTHCLLDNPICDGTNCIMGDLNKINIQVRNYLTNTKLSGLAYICEDKKPGDMDPV
ncbi:MAG: Rrf2 family transcriptional regulator [Candidatus Eremiobacterota bacterium]